jgi:hypothetical protein
MAEVNILKLGEGIAIFERRKQPRRRVELLFDYSPLVEREDRGGTLADANEGGLQVYLPERLQVWGFVQDQDLCSRKLRS